MVFPAVILSTATTRQSTSAMAGCLPTAPRHVDVGDDDDRRCWTGYRIVICRSNSGRFRSIRNGNDGTGHAQDPDCTQQRENGLDGQQWKWWWTMESFIKQRDRCQQRHIIHQQQEIKDKTTRSKWFGVQRWPCCPFDGGQCHVLFSVRGSIRRLKISAVS